jgi:TolA-binding protein
MKRSHKIFCAAASIALSVGVAQAKPKRAPVSDATGKARPEASAYLDELEKRGLTDKTLGTPERLAAEVRAADDDLVAGNPAMAAARLYAIVEGPRWQDLSDTDDFQDAEYRLGIALHRGGGAATARHYLVKSLQRGQKGPFFTAALRAYVDVCLDERALDTCVAELDRVVPSLEGKGDEVSAQEGEIAYLRGRAAFEAGRADDAEDELKKIAPKSRFYSSALYLRGVLRVQKKDLKGAQDAFCAVADVKEGDTLRFYIDGRYYAIKDLARLALGRVAHEEGRYEDAFYHYFLIPQDSSRLGEALFEAAWSSLQRKDYHLGARLVDEFLKEFPRSPKAAEAHLLYATLQVKTCRFAEAEKGFGDFITSNEPLLQSIDRALADPGVRNALAQRILQRNVDADKNAAPAKTDEDRIAELLQVDGRFFRLQALARGLRAEALDAGHVENDWKQLQAKIGGTQVQSVFGTAPDAATLRKNVVELGIEVARTRSLLRKKSGAEADELKKTVDALESRRRELLATLDRTIDVEGLEESREKAGVAGLGPMVAADREHAEKLRERVALLDARLERASGDLILKALGDLRGHLEDLLRRARLGKIDAVVGQKRKLERQIEDLAAGRFPPEMFGKLHIEGLIKDDEEYWPPEKEIWLDEYENYK